MGLEFTRGFDDVDYYDIAALELETAAPDRHDIQIATSEFPGYSQRTSGQILMATPTVITFALRAYRAAPLGTIDVLLPSELLGSRHLPSTVLDIADALNIPDDQVIWPEHVRSHRPPEREPTMSASSARNSYASRPFRPDLPASESERRVLVIGEGITVQGVINDAEYLVVRGKLEANIQATEVLIASGGIVTGQVESEAAEIAGIIHGTVIAHDVLSVRDTGQVHGAVRCRRLLVESGAQITGLIEMIALRGRMLDPPSPLEFTHGARSLP